MRMGRRRREDLLQLLQGFSWRRVQGSFGAANARWQELRVFRERFLEVGLFARRIRRQGGRFPEELSGVEVVSSQARFACVELRGVERRLALERDLRHSIE